MADRETVRVNVNGNIQVREVEPRQLLVHFLRTECGLTGTHVGCDTAYCGASSVHLDGKAVKSCNVLTMQADGRSVRTVEGLETPTGLSVLQKSFSELHALQCGFCTPGMLMAASALLESDAEVNEQSIRKALGGNVCRCTGYQNIFAAVMDAAEKLGRHPQ
jgi:carbon-monoxide dehydrogenase small subunit